MEQDEETNMSAAYELNSSFFLFLCAGGHGGQKGKGKERESFHALTLH
jgi:hypothetical protein